MKSPSLSLYAELMMALLVSWRGMAQRMDTLPDTDKPRQNEELWTVIKQDLFPPGDELLCSTTDPGQTQDFVYGI